jgi:PAS domain S-box-containing protein
MSRRFFFLGVAGLLIAAVLGTSLFSARVLDLDARSAEREAVGARLDQVRVSLERALANRLSLLNGLGAFIRANPDFDEAAFERFAEFYGSRIAGLRTLSLAPGGVVRHLYPLAGNEAALGHDLLNDPNRRDDALKALQSRGPVISDRVTLLQGGTAFIARERIDGADPGRPWGLAVLVIDDRSLMAEAGLTVLKDRVVLRAIHPDGTRSKPFFGAGDIDAQDPVRMGVDLPNGAWEIAAVPAAGWATGTGRRVALYAPAVFAILLAVLLVWVARSGVNQMREKVRSARSEAEDARHALNLALDSISEGFTYYDSQDRLVLCNQRYREIYEKSADAMLPGARFEDILIHGLNSGQYAEAIGREQEWLEHRLLLHRNPPDHPIEQRLADGRWLLISERRTPDGGIAGIRTDITELKVAQQQLEASNRDLERKVEQRFAEARETMKLLEEEVRERATAQAALENEVERNAMLVAVIEATPSGVVIADATRADIPIIYCNRAFTEITGYDATEVIGRNCRFLTGPDTNPDDRQKLRQGLADGRAVEAELLNYRKDGSEFWNFLSLFPVRDADGSVAHFVGIQTDATERRRTAEEKVRIERQVVENSKFEALGTLAGGVAHEINTPTQFIGDNIRFLNDAFGSMAKATSALQDALVRSGQPDVASAIANENDLTFLTEEVPGALKQTLDGVARIGEIVRAVKEYSHPGQDGGTQLDLNATVETAITLSRNQWKYVAQVDRHFDPKLPNIEGRPGELAQVVLNMLVNAAHAIEERGGKEPGRIVVSTMGAADGVVLTIRDNGSGMPAERLRRIFEMFYTTKPPGKGTGQGLAICHAIVVKGHRGHIDVDSAPGRGTTFRIYLPLRRVEAA